MIAFPVFLLTFRKMQIGRPTENSGVLAAVAGMLAAATGKPHSETCRTDSPWKRQSTGMKFAVITLTIISFGLLILVACIYLLFRRRKQKQLSASANGIAAGNAHGSL